MPPVSLSRSTCMLYPPPFCPPLSPLFSKSQNPFTILLNLLIPPSFARSNPISSLMTELTSFQEKSQSILKPNRHLTNIPRFPAADRIIAIGDVHGDVSAMRYALSTAKLIDSNDNWTGGKTVLVQVGDQMDRGSSERDIYKLLFHLQDVAPTSGGRVHILLGNHELMNSKLDFRYVTKGGFQDFAKDGTLNRRGRISAEMTDKIKMLPREMRARAKSVAAGGQLAAELGERARVSLIVGDNVFVHGGLTPKHLRFGGYKGGQSEQMLNELNCATGRFLKGEASLPGVLRGGASPVWLRDYSRVSVRGGSEACRMLSETLKMIGGVRRMIVGHTPQVGGINSACGGRVWRIDTGMSKAYGGVPEAIEISKRGGIRIYTPEGLVQGSARYK